MSCKILKFKANPKIIDLNRKKLLILEEKLEKIGKNIPLKKWFKIRDEIRRLKRSLS